MAHSRAGWFRFVGCLVVAVMAAAPLAAQVKVETLAANLDGAVGGVAVDRLGNIYVADFGEKVWKITPWGDVSVLTSSMYGSSGNAVAPNGDLLQSSFYSGTLSRIARDGTVTTLATGLQGPVGVTVNTDNQIYVCDCRANRVERVSDQGEVTDFAVSDLLHCPNGLTHDTDGNLYVANFMDGHVLKIDTKGKTSVVATIPGGGNGHLVAVGKTLYVTGFRANRVFEVSEDGKVEAVAGSGPFGEQDGGAEEAKFSTPNGLAYDPKQDVLYTNDLLLTWTQRFAGRSRPRSTLRKVVFPTLGEVVQSAFQAGGATAVKAAIHQYVSSHTPHPWQPILNGIGYGYLQDKHVEAAIAVFEANTELFPKAFNTWDSLAEAHKDAGHRDQAIEYYRKSLALNPDNQNAKKMLAELGVKE